MRAKNFFTFCLFVSWMPVSSTLSYQKNNMQNIVCVLMYMTSKSSVPGLTRADNQMLVDWSPNLCFPDI